MIISKHLPRYYLSFMVFLLVGLITLKLTEPQFFHTTPTISDPLYPSPTSIYVNKSIVLDENLPQPIRESVSNFVKNNTNYQYKVDDGISISSIETPNLIYREIWTYTTLFNSLREEVTDSEIPNLSKLYVLTTTDDFPTTGISPDNIIKVNNQVDLLTQMTKDDIALVKFDELIPQLKVLTYNNQSILDKTITNDQWTTSINYYLSENAPSDLVEYFKTQPNSKRDISKLTTLVMTGVTAISRGVEYEIRTHNDPIFPARGVMDVLLKADLTHVDSENPFFEGCIPADEGIVLCGLPRSIESLKAIGTDIVDLTGNHQNDYGPEKNLESIGYLEAAGFSYVGGGKDVNDAAKILYKVVNGTKLAFLGYAYFDSLNGPTYRSLAQEDYPGTNFYDEEKLKADIQTAKANADFVIVDYQFIENYSYEPIPGQYDVFRNTIVLGADLVVGVQSHQPQFIEFRDGKPIFYGLGNLFFDQMWSLGTRQGIIPRFTFYNGKLISIEVMTTLLYEYAQPRFVTGKDRLNILNEVLPANVY